MKSYIQKNKKPKRTNELQKELTSIDKQINDLLEMARQVKHQRPMLEKIDQLEDEREDVLTRIIHKCCCALAGSFVHNESFLNFP